MRRKKSIGWWYSLASSSTSTRSNRHSPETAVDTNDCGRRKCRATSDCVSPASARACFSRSVVSLSIWVPPYQETDEQILNDVDDDKMELWTWLDQGAEVPDGYWLG